MAKQHKDTIISHLEINIMALNSQLHDVNEILKYINEKQLLKKSTTTDILNQTLKMYIEINNSLLNLSKKS